MDEKIKHASENEKTRTSKEHENEQSGNDEERTSTPPQELETMWGGIWKDLSINADPKVDDAWQRAVDASKKENPREMLDGQRFNGPSE